MHPWHPWRQKMRIFVLIWQSNLILWWRWWWYCYRTYAAIASQQSSLFLWYRWRWHCIRTVWRVGENGSVETALNSHMSGLCVCSRVCVKVCVCAANGGREGRWGQSVSIHHILPDDFTCSLIKFKLTFALLMTSNDNAAFDIWHYSGLTL